VVLEGKLSDLFYRASKINAKIDEKHFLNRVSKKEKFIYICSIKTHIIMSFSDLFDSEFKSRNKGHFSAIVRVATADAAMSKEEKEFLDKLAVRLEISKDEYEEILENPLKYPINPPYLHTQRLERLYDLSRMVYADHVLGPKQKEILTKFALALGFTPGNVPFIIDKAMSLLILNVDLDTFVYEMTHMNK
jgi:uncharacterized tellurite resistance protein B-like protein